MNPRKKILTLVGLLFLVAGTVSAPASAQCPNGWGKWKNMPIRVLINENMDDLLCGTSSCNSLTDIRNTIQAVLSEIYNTTGGALRFEISGTTTVPPTTIIPGYLHIFSNPCSGVLAIAAADGDASEPWGKIRMCSTNNGNPINWNSYHHETTSSGTTFVSFQLVLLHEIGHVVGLDHIEACNPSNAPASVMRGAYSSQLPHHLLFPDTSFFENEYGLRSNDGHAHASSDALSWPTEAGAPNLSSTLGRLAATNTRSGSHLFVARTDPWSARVHLSRYTGSSWSHLTTLPYWSHAHPGIASRSNQDLLVSHVGAYQTDTGLQSVYVQESHNAGTTWDPAEIVSTSTTRTANPGTSSTYDPASGLYVTLWRGAPTDRNAILYYVEGSSTPYKLQQPSTGDDVVAADTPSMACAPTWVAGSDNCLIAWADGRSWSRVVRWAQGRIVNGQLVLSTIKTHGYASVGSPSVAYSSTGTHPWHLALNQGGSVTYTWRKGPSVNDGFVDQRNFSHGPVVTLPAAGSRASSTGRYVFTLNP